MMFCHRCGDKIPDGAAFCKKCGAKLVAGKTPDPAAVPDAEMRFSSHKELDRALDNAEAYLLKSFVEFKTKLMEEISEDKLLAAPAAPIGAVVETSINEMIQPQPQPTGAKFCQKCGSRLPDGAKFCKTCGANANVGYGTWLAPDAHMSTDAAWSVNHAEAAAQEAASVPFPTSARESGGLKGKTAWLGGRNDDLIKSLIGKNSDYYLEQFDRLDKGKRSFNWCAFLIAPILLLYRRQYSYFAKLIFPPLLLAFALVFYFVCATILFDVELFFAIIHVSIAIGAYVIAAAIACGFGFNRHYKTQLSIAVSNRRLLPDGFAGRRYV